MANRKKPFNLIDPPTAEEEALESSVFNDPAFIIASMLGAGIAAEGQAARAALRAGAENIGYPIGVSGALQALGAVPELVRGVRSQTAVKAPTEPFTAQELASANKDLPSTEFGTSMPTKSIDIPDWGVPPTASLVESGKTGQLTAMDIATLHNPKAKEQFEALQAALFGPPRERPSEKVALGGKQFTGKSGEPFTIKGPEPVPEDFPDVLYHGLGVPEADLNMLNDPKHQREALERIAKRLKKIKQYGLESGWFSEKPVPEFGPYYLATRKQDLPQGRAADPNPAYPYEAKGGRAFKLDPRFAEGKAARLLESKVPPSKLQLLLRGSKEVPFSKAAEPRPLTGGKKATRLLLDLLEMLKGVPKE